MLPAAIIPTCHLADSIAAPGLISCIMLSEPWLGKMKLLSHFDVTYEENGFLGPKSRVRNSPGEIVIQLLFPSSLDQVSAYAASRNYIE